MLSQVATPSDSDVDSPSSPHLDPSQLSGPAHFEKIASYLIRENFSLTALEFYMELLEMGHEVVRLKEYFSNPENFEKSKFPESSTFSTKLTRTSSIQTFDSLDFSRYSDDGERCENDRIAVLEFELRKAQEKINSLRSALTKSSETAKKIQGDKEIENINSNVALFEKRAINFLINEYLLKQGYKLTSVTFSEENDNQDFDDWDDVGLNISKPTDLMSLFHDFGKQAKCVEKKDFGCNVDFVEETPDTLQKDNESLKEKINELEKNISEMYRRNEEVEETIVTKAESNLEEIVPEEQEEINDDKRVDDVSSEPQDSNGSETATVTECVENSGSTDEYQNYLIELIINKNFGNDLHYFNADDSSHNFEKLISCLGNTLPTIVPNILVAKRDQLLPLLLFTVMHHSCSKKRDELLNLIFNLIKRPDEAQRRVIMRGCLTFSRHMQPVQVESELLPQCWEQITHKYLERRLLVAETCGVLSAYVHNDTRVSLLFSMIKQLADDKEEELREATVKSFAILVSFIEDDDKYNQMTEMICKFMHDSSEKVSEACIHFLLPSFSRWCLRLDCLQQFTSKHLLTAFDSSTCKSGDSSSLIVKDAQVFKNAVASLNQALPYIFASVISSCPPLEQQEGGVEVASKMFKLTPDFQSKILKLSEQEAALLIRNYHAVIRQEWFECWPELHWVSNGFLLKLIIFLSKLEISPPLIKLVIQFFQNLATIFGANFISAQVKFRFEKYLSSMNDQLHPNTSYATMSIVPVYVAGLHPCLIFNHSESLKHKDSLTKFLCHLLSSLSLSCLPLTSIQSSFVVLSRYDDLEGNSSPMFRELLLKVLWEFGVVHKNMLIRVSTSKMFEWLISNCGYHESHISSKILPALITLANDPDESVRVSTVSPFGSLIEYISNTLNVDSKSKIFEKIQLQIKTFMGDQTSTFNNNNIILEIVKVLGKIGPRIDAKLRDDFVLPRLTTLAIKNQITQNLDPKFKLDITLKLLDAFISALCCYVDDKISREVILPGLRCLLHDIQNVAPNRADVVSSMIRELEEKTEHKKQSTEKVQSNSKGHISIDSETPRTKFLNKFKDSKNVSKIFHGYNK